MSGVQQESKERPTDSPGRRRTEYASWIAGIISAIAAVAVPAAGYFGISLGEERSIIRINQFYTFLLAGLSEDDRRQIADLITALREANRRAVQGESATSIATPAVQAIESLIRSVPVSNYTTGARVFALPAGQTAIACGGQTRITYRGRQAANSPRFIVLINGTAWTPAIGEDTRASGTEIVLLDYRQREAIFHVVCP